MQHSQWLGLKADSEALASLRASGEQIVMALRALDYQCIKATQTLLWTIRKGEIFYRLTWLSSPLNEWSLLPIDGTRQRQKLLSQILAVVEIYRESGVSQISPSSESQEGDSTTLSLRADRAKDTDPKSDLLQAAAQRSRFWLEKNYPWIIVQLLPNAQRYVVARFHSRVEAQHHQRFLSRFIPNGEFEVVFESET